MPLLVHSITYRIAVGPQVGRKVFTLQTLPASDEPFDDGVGKVTGFSLHTEVAARADERKKLERLCRYISRPAVSEKPLSLTPNGNIHYQIKTPYRDGTPHVNHVGVKNLDDSIGFYSALFGAEPEKTKVDYAKWLLDDPCGNFAISTRVKNGVDHLGIQVDEESELAALRERLKSADMALSDEDETVCCYARSDKS